MPSKSATPRKSQAQTPDGPTSEGSRITPSPERDIKPKDKKSLNTRVHNHGEQTKEDESELRRHAKEADYYR